MCDFIGPHHLFGIESHLPKSLLQTSVLIKVLLGVEDDPYIFVTWNYSIYFEDEVANSLLLYQFSIQLIFIEIYRVYLHIE